jgi:hypothetical protein
MVSINILDVPEHLMKPHIESVLLRNGVQSFPQLVGAKRSLIPRGWQRAGALASFFASAAVPAPDQIYVSAPGKVARERVLTQF